MPEDPLLVAIRVADDAMTADEFGNYRRALSLYIDAIERFIIVMKTERHSKRELLRSKVGELLQRCDQIRNFLSNRNETSMSYQDKIKMVLESDLSNEDKLRMIRLFTE